jgi:hypothetical protein
MQKHPVPLSRTPHTPRRSPPCILLSQKPMYIRRLSRQPVFRLWLIFKCILQTRRLFFPLAVLPSAPRL